MLFDLVHYQLLKKHGIQEQDLFSILYDCSKYKIDYADIYFQSFIAESWVLDNKIIKEGSYNIDQGFGIRVINEESTGFSYSDQITLKSLQQSRDMACSYLLDKSVKKKNKFCRVKYNSVYSNSYILNSFTIEQKIDILKRIDTVARNIDHRVIQVNAVLSGCDENVLIAATDETFVSDIRPLVHISISVIVEDKSHREKGNRSGGGRIDYSFFLEKNEFGEIRIESWAREAVEAALVNLSAKEAPSGTFPVVLGSGWPGILLHEAVGHGLEGDFNFRKSSVFSEKINKKVSSSLCTIIDNGTLLNKRGSISIDDEGTPSQCNILIKNGILKKYMQDKLNAKLMRALPTGNGRRESYRCLPKPRMTNTYMLPGNSSFIEIISSVDYGILASNFSGGQVDITSGNFVFSTSEAFLLKNGKIKYPIKGVTLIGSGIDVMKQVSMVGNDFKMDEGSGICVKDGQSIPVGVGQPTIKLDKLTVGGLI